MKYRHRTTGEIINVLRHNERGDFAECTDNNGKVYGLQANLFRDYEQVIEDKTINWEQRRYEIAKAMLPAIYMDMADSDIDKIQQAGISKTQQYKLAGNSIVVSCLYHVFRKMFIDHSNEQKGYVQLSLF